MVSATAAPGKAASETALGGDDRRIQRRKLKRFHVYGTVDLTDHDTGVLGPDMEE